MYRYVTFLIFTFTLLVSQTSAQQPGTISYQGLLTDAAGAAVSDGMYRLTLKLYHVESNGTASWTETQDVTVVDGYFNVILGTKEPLRLLFDRQLWLGITVGTDTELSPRIRLTSAAYSIRAQRADTANTALRALQADMADDAQTVGGYAVSPTPGANRLLVLDAAGKFPANAIPSVPAEVQDGSLTGVKIASGEVVKSINMLHDDVELAAGSNVSITPMGNVLTISATPGGGGGDITAVTTLPGSGLTGGGQSGDVSIAIADGGVRTAKLQDGAVTTGKLADQSVTSVKLADQSVSNAKLADQSVSNVKLADQSVSNIKLADQSVTSVKLADQSVTAVKLSGQGAATGQMLRYNGTDVEWATPGSGGGTLDMAYDHGGSGAGKDIIADAGAVTIGGVDGFLVTGTTGNGSIPATGAGTRMMFYPAKQAFRAGYVSGTEWDDAKTGTGSAAIGVENIASGAGASAFGLVNIASGSGSIASGALNSAAGEYAVTLGVSNTASGLGACSLGETNAANGKASLAFGHGCSTYGDYSIAAGSGSSANGDYSVAMGYTAYASGTYAVSLGYTSATALASFAAGYNSSAENEYSVAMGKTATATGSTSLSIGSLTTAAGESAVALGHVTKASGSYSVAMGYQTEADGTGAVAAGYETVASGAYSTAMGQNTAASNYHATAMGYATTASGSTSTAMGYSTTASGEKSTAMGSYVSTDGKTGSFIIGDASTTSVWTSPLDNQMKMRFAGGYQLYTNSTATTGVYMNGNTSGWINFSDRNRKENFREVDGEQLLAKVRALPVTAWNYKDSDPSVRYIGPMAQDFWQAFHLGGTDSLGINSIAIDGVNLAAIKALETRTRQLREVTAQLQLSTELLSQAREDDNHSVLGEGQLENGRVHIDLDTKFQQTVTVSAKHPLKVFVQLEDDCNGVYITNKSATGFDVVELQKGRSHARFSYRVVCKRKYYEDERLATEKEDIALNKAMLETAWPEVIAEREAMDAKVFGDTKRAEEVRDRLMNVPPPSTATPSK